MWPLDAQAFAELLSPKTKVVALVHVSNMLGSILDTAYVAEQARKVCSFKYALQGTLLDDSPCLECDRRVEHPSATFLLPAAEASRVTAQGRIRQAPEQMKMCKLTVCACDRWVPRCCWTAPSRCPGCPQTFRPWAQTGLWPQATRCVGPLASDSCGAGESCR